MLGRRIAALAVVLAEAFGDLQADGFTASASPMIELPDVESVLSKATGRIQDLAISTGEIYRRIADQEQQGREFLKVRKEGLERNLTEQAYRNRVQVQQNRDLNARLDKLKQDYEQRREVVGDLSRKVDMMRATFSALRGKLGLAGEFIQETLRVSDTSEIEALPVLTPPKPRPSIKRLLETEAPADFPLPGEGKRLLETEAPADFPLPGEGHRAMALLQGRPSRASFPSTNAESVKAGGGGQRAETDDSFTFESYVQGLQNSLNEMRASQEQGEAKLTAKYGALFANGDAVYRDLKTREAQLLNAALAHQEAIEQLEAAGEKLVEFHAKLFERLRGIAMFAEQLQATAARGIASFESNNTTEPSPEPADESEGVEGRERADATEPVPDAAGESEGVESEGVGHRKRRHHTRAHARHRHRTTAPGKVKAAHKRHTSAFYRVNATESPTDAVEETVEESSAAGEEPPPNASLPQLTLTLPPAGLLQDVSRTAAAGAVGNETPSASASAQGASMLGGLGRNDSTWMQPSRNWFFWRY